MNIYALSGLFTVMTGLTIAPLIFLNSRKRDRFVNGLWLLLNIAISLYGLGIYISANSPDYDTGLLGWRIAYTGVTLIPALLLHHAYRFTGAEIKRRTLVVLYGLSLLFLYLSLTTPHFFELRSVFGFWYPDALPPDKIANISYLSFIAYFFLLGLATIHKVWRVRAAATGERRTHLTLFLVAIIVGWGGGSYSFLPTFRVDAFPYFNISIPIYQIIIAYAIVRYGLFHTKVITAEVLAAFIAVMFLATAFAPPSVVLQGVLFVGLVATLVISIRSALSETKAREELKYLNEHLQQKVDEQTKEVKRAYEVEKKARQDLEELDKTKDQFILTTQHHLRTPLTIIKGYLAVLKNDGSLSEENKSSIDKVTDSTETLSKFVNELLQVTELKVTKDEEEKRG